MSDLLPCPWCGGPAVVIEKTGYVKCGHVSRHGYGRNAEEWNSRASSSGAILAKDGEQETEQGDAWPTPAGKIWKQLLETLNRPDNDRDYEPGKDPLTIIESALNVAEQKVFLSMCVWAITQIEQLKGDKLPESPPSWASG